jgi:hypothetical protein
MPSVSKKQHNFMAAIAHSPAFAKKVGVPQSVGKDFNEADKGKKFGKGGNTMATTKVNPKMVAALMAAKRASAPPMRAPAPQMPPVGMKKGGMKKMAEGGMTKKEDMKQDKAMADKEIKKAFKEHDMQEHKGGKGTTLKLKKGGIDMKMKMKKMAKGGMTETSMGKVKTNTKAPHGDGIAERGKTRAMMPKMKGKTV